MKEKKSIFDLAQASFVSALEHSKGADKNSVNITVKATKAKQGLKDCLPLTDGLNCKNSNKRLFTISQTSTYFTYVTKQRYIYKQSKQNGNRQLLLREK